METWRRKRLSSVKLSKPTQERSTLCWEQTGGTWKINEGWNWNTVCMCPNYGVGGIGAGARLQGIWLPCSALLVSFLFLIVHISLTVNKSSICAYLSFHPLFFNFGVFRTQFQPTVHEFVFILYKKSNDSHSSAFISRNTENITIIAHISLWTLR